MDKYITSDEYSMLREELASRLKDVVYMDADREVVSMLESLDIKKLDLEEEDYESSFTFSFEVKMIFGDILQIIGRQRRE